MVVIKLSGGKSGWDSEVIRRRTCTFSAWQAAGANPTHCVPGPCEPPKEPHHGPVTMLTMNIANAVVPRSVWQSSTTLMGLMPCSRDFPTPPPL